MLERLFGPSKKQKELDQQKASAKQAELKKTAPDATEQKGVSKQAASKSSTALNLDAIIATFPHDQQPEIRALLCTPVSPVPVISNEEILETYRNEEAREKFLFEQMMRFDISVQDLKRCTDMRIQLIQDRAARYQQPAPAGAAPRSPQM